MANKEVIWAPGGWRKTGCDHLQQADSTLALLKAASAGFIEGATLETHKVLVHHVSLSAKTPKVEPLNLYRQSHAASYQPCLDFTGDTR